MCIRDRFYRVRLTSNYSAKIVPHKQGRGKTEKVLQESNNLLALSSKAAEAQKLWWKQEDTGVYTGSEEMCQI